MNIPILLARGATRTARLWLPFEVDSGDAQGTAGGEPSPNILDLQQALDLHRANLRAGMAALDNVEIQLAIELLTKTATWECS
ncbi:MAG TPA: hypothetical protein VMU17_00200, partial [Elusimicrobiota bacterium]|nr:hypothetical protein [Elusimicrobiota bacterium]